MGEDRRQSDRRLGPVDRRDPSSQFQGERNLKNPNYNNKKTYITLTTFIITIAVLLIITIGIILLVYTNLNNKINELDFYYNDYCLYDDYYDYNSNEDSYFDNDTDLDPDIDVESDVTTPNLNSTTETNNN